jgi:hypothetical protein
MTDGELKRTSMTSAALTGATDVRRGLPARDGPHGLVEPTVVGGTSH